MSEIFVNCLNVWKYKITQYEDDQNEKNSPLKSIVISSFSHNNQGRVNAWIDSFSFNSVCHSLNKIISVHSSY